MRNDFAEMFAQYRCRWRDRGYSNKERRCKLKQSKNDPDGLYHSTKNSKCRREDWDFRKSNMKFSPIDRLLEKQVGKKWDVIYSEFHTHCRKKSHRFILEMLDWYVDKNNEFETREDGTIHYVSYCGSELPDKRFYVDNQGILRRYKKTYKKKKKEVTRIDVNDTSFIEKNDGIWYYYEFRSTNKEPIIRKFWVSYREEYHYYKTYEKHHCYYLGDRVSYPDRTWYAICKKQLNSKELEEYKIKND